ncbi:MAG: SCO family protein [Cytophagales bacterium]|nr:SCO family protein [Cytophagales bacterium]MDW8383285.1 SCO family protein [Flammeovirgaceae bacterium]
MNRKIQFLILGVILLLPAFIFIFLHVAGRNVYRVPEVNPFDSLNILNPQNINCPDYRVNGVHRIPPFRLLNQDSVEVSEEIVKGKIYVAAFFFTRCGNICLDMSRQMYRLQETFKNYPDVLLLSYSVDPEFDRPKVLKMYSEKYQADPNKWIFLTGNKDSIYELARCGYYVVAKPYENRPNDFIHSDKLVLVDKQKRIRGYYSGTLREDVDRLITEIQVLMREQQKPL